MRGLRDFAFILILLCLLALLRLAGVKPGDLIGD